MPESVALSIHGPAGVLDLLVPAGATTHDVARSYAQETRLPSIPLLQTSLGQHLRADQPVQEAGLRSGDVLVAVLGLPRSRTAAKQRSATTAREDRTARYVVVAAAAAVALLAAWAAARAGDPAVRMLVAWCLGGGALLGLLPAGRLVRERAVVSPAFAAAAAYAVLGDRSDYQSSAVVAAGALVAAAVAAVARAALPPMGRDDGRGLAPVDDDGAQDALLVWMVSGAVVAAVCGGAVLLEFAPQVPWAVLLAAAVIAGRLGPSYAVDVPDEVLLDLDRLAVTAWSARDQQPGRGRRGRMVVPEATVRRLVRRGSRLVTAIAVAVVATVSVAAPRLLATTTVDVDLWGARVLLVAGGFALVLVARSYRHRAARMLLRTAGLWCLAVALADHFRHAPDGFRYGVLAACVVVGAVCVAVAVATGRGWRSVWWSRRAEIAETLCGTLAIAATVVATGVMRHFWELNS